MPRTLPRYVVPGLVWPSEDIKPLLDPSVLPGLARLLAAGRAASAPGRPLDDWLCEEFGLHAPAPLAALRLAGETSFVSESPSTLDGHWLCADPVSLHFARDQLLLGAPDDLDIAADEALAIVADLNAQFSDIGQFIAATPQRWYLRCAHAPNVHLPSLADAAGRPVAYFQPDGEARAEWARTTNELQVFCHNHPLNARREAAGLAPINALWLWGAGTPQTPAARIASGRGDAHPLFVGLCRAAGVPCDTSGGHDFVSALQVFTPLQTPALQRDASHWLAGLARLDTTLFAPLADALDAGTLDALQLVSPSDRCLLTLDVRARPRWKFWGRSASPDALLALLHTPNPAASPRATPSS